MKKKLNVQDLIFLAVIAFLAVAPLFVNALYLRILLNAELMMIFSMSLNLLMGIGGTVSFGHAAFYGIGAYVASVLWYHFRWTYSQTFPFVLLITGLSGLLLSLPMSRVTGRYVTIITLSFSEIVNLIMKNWNKVTLGQMGIVGIPTITVFGYTLKNKTEFYYFAMVFVILTWLIMKWLVDSKLGRNLRAMSNDAVAAEAMGIKLFPHKVIVFTVSAVFAGIAGSLYAHLLSYVEPSAFSSAVSFQCISVVVIGGLGNFSGSLLGSLFLTILPEYLRRFKFLFKYRMIVYGMVLVAVMWLNHSIPGSKLKQLFSLKKKSEEEEVVS